MSGEYSLKRAVNRAAFSDGVKVGVPIALGYFVVAFALGVQAKAAGLTAFQCGLASLFCLASAGEYVGFASIAEHASYLTIILATIVANARYFLMGCALSQRTSPSLSLGYRTTVALGITDELFGMSILRPGVFNPWFAYGIMAIAAPAWSAGSALGVIGGNVLPPSLGAALSVALFGMFLAVIIPPSRKNKVVASLVALSFLFSYLATKTPVLSECSGGSRVVILTIVLASIAAIAFPVAEDEDSESENEARVEENSSQKKEQGDGRA